jgi:hypothetical protein
MGAALWRSVRDEELPEFAPLPAQGIRFRHCVVVFGEQRAPWRDSVHEALDDAIALELASWDPSEQQHFLAVPVEIKTEKVRDAPG